MAADARTDSFSAETIDSRGEGAVGLPRSAASTLPARKVTRSAAAAALRVSVTTVRRWEGELLHPERGPDGVHVFDLAEIEALARQRPAQEERARNGTAGEVAAAAFALFKKGVDPRDVVIELEQPPDVIKKLQAEWHLMGDRLILGEETVRVLDRMSSARLIDPEVLSAIYNDDHEWLREHVTTKLEERRRQRRS
jgi:hypothetical protein